jgi:hypothetical protein
MSTVSIADARSEAGTHSFLRHKLFTDLRVDLGAGEDASLTYRISPNEIAP